MKNIGKSEIPPLYFPLVTLAPNSGSFHPLLRSSFRFIKTRWQIIDKK
jgi:hypothetical protein